MLTFMAETPMELHNIMQISILHIIVPEIPPPWELIKCFTVAKVQPLFAPYTIFMLKYSVELYNFRFSYNMKEQKIWKIIVLLRMAIKKIYNMSVTISFNTYFFFFILNLYNFIWYFLYYINIMNITVHNLRSIT
jgi:hypothetical protein